MGKAYSFVLRHMSLVNDLHVAHDEFPVAQLSRASNRFPEGHGLDSRLSHACDMVNVT